MELIKRVKVYGHWYQIIFPYEFDDDSAGQCDYEKKIIYIAGKDKGRDRHPNSIFVTLIHEITHAIDFSAGHHIFYDNHLSLEQNEMAIHGFSEGMFQVMMDNGMDVLVKNGRQKEKKTDKKDYQKG